MGSANESAAIDIKVREILLTVKKANIELKNLRRVNLTTWTALLYEIFISGGVPGITFSMSALLKVAIAAKAAI